ncbi:ATP-binding protein [Nonomuraea basaltis]|uniref:ATP-binding protein n=1 Tax=Nonomuraea basaltis TaxID=2495887 RepID=UPI00110C4E0C|nr:ATP-binding protein [Nonomuraea basaltis]TMR88670.1 ATP-binding protein [Nonomuraea basaltis]
MGHDLALRTGWTGQERTVSWTLSARPSAVPTARRMTAARLSAWDLAEQADVAQLLAGELVADALRAGAEKIKLTLSAEDGLLRCEIGEERSQHREPAAAAAPPCPAPLLDRLACCWGTAGPVVWFELYLSPQN